uniref:Uncharacterized protein n=1 Tax=Cacopsylla melanoneura TaxID=428564 RepID=A0A8D8Q2D0_9HEMI
MANLLPKFKFNSSTVREDLVVFKRQFLNYLIIVKAKEEEVKKAYLELALAEESECLNLIKIEKYDKLEDVFNKLEEVLLPQENVILNQFKFFQRKQELGENFDAFVKELKKLVRSCQFKEQEDNILKVRIVLGLRDARTQERLLRTPDLSLQEVINHCRTSEQASVGLEIVENPVHAIQTLQSKHNETGGRIQGGSFPSVRQYEASQGGGSFPSVRQHEASQGGGNFPRQDLT